MTECVELDEATHRYTYQGRPVPGVTQIIAGLGISALRWVPPDALLRGSVVHRCIELYLHGRLDWSSVDARALGFVKAAVKFCDEAAIKPASAFIEHKVFHPTMLFAGRVDLIAPAFGIPSVIDWKCNMGLHAGLQTAAYEVAHRASVGGIPMRRMAVVLKDDGTYTNKTYNDVQDYEDWKACVRVYNKFLANKNP